MLTLSPGPIWMIRGDPSGRGVAGLFALGDCAAFEAAQQIEQTSRQSPDLTIIQRIDTPKPPGKTLKIMSPRRSSAQRRTYITIPPRSESIDSDRQFPIL